MHRINNARELAVWCMHEVEEKHLLIPDAFEHCHHTLSEVDLRLSHEIVYGTYRFHPGLKKSLRKHLPKYERLPGTCRRILLTALYQLLFTRVPEYAVINESVSLCQNMKIGGLKALVNAVLRKCQNQKEALLRDSEKHLAEWVLPEWYRTWLEKHYAGQWQSWVPGLAERPSQMGWTTGKRKPGDGPLPHAYEIEGAPNQKEYIQNESSQAIGELALMVNPKRMWDCCAAPGGKSFYINNFGNLERHLANEPDHHRFLILRENLHRLDLPADLRETRAQDGAKDELFDLVLVDAPCSALGIIGRHPEIKLLRKNPADQVIMNAQKSLVEAAWAHVEPEGYLLYSVCSIDPNELTPLPEDALLPTAILKAFFDLDLPVKSFQHGFMIEPSSRFDGFLGFLAQKPPKPEEEEDSEE